MRWDTPGHFSTMLGHRWDSSGTNGVNDKMELENRKLISKGFSTNISLTNSIEGVWYELKVTEIKSGIHYQTEIEFVSFPNLLFHLGILFGLILGYFGIGKENKPGLEDCMYEIRQLNDNEYF